MITLANWDARKFITYGAVTVIITGENVTTVVIVPPCMHILSPMENAQFAGKAR